MPNTVFVGGIDVRMDETEIRSFFARYGSVKEVKIITDRTGVSKGYGFVSFYNDVDVQKIVESQINFHGKKLKLGPAIRKQNLCAYHVQPRPLVFNPPPPPQFQSVWSNPNTETYMQPPTMMNPITQYVQTYPPYPSSPVQVITGYQLPVYNYQMPPQWPAGEQRSYVIPPAYTTVNYHCNEVDSGAEVLQSECSVHEATPSSGNGPQKKSVDRSIQTVVSCLFNPENRLRNSVVTQDDYFKSAGQKECLLNHQNLISEVFAAAEMGCRLNKLEKRDDKRPGNIYSTLKRPQVETKIDVSYEYRFLDFTTLTAGEYWCLVFPVTGELGPGLALQPYPGQDLQLRLPQSVLVGPDKDILGELSALADVIGTCTLTCGAGRGKKHQESRS
ncbi:Deleted in azoospermia-like protein [Pteropus alecto]|uniref:Deleted in azoospermia-like protein n=1 Tax=Pteropus alecto TaxID=9402 RepID=L5KZ58_PTEAL|nr:Deleted in azoospermia-like protein [Pteropus alecto]